MLRPESWHELGVLKSSLIWLLYLDLYFLMDCRSLNMVRQEPWINISHLFRSQNSYSPWFISVCYLPSWPPSSPTMLYPEWRLHAWVSSAVFRQLSLFLVVYSCWMNSWNGIIGPARWWSLPGWSEWIGGKGQGFNQKARLGWTRYIYVTKRHPSRCLFAFTFSFSLFCIKLRLSLLLRRF